MSTEMRDAQADRDHIDVNALRAVLPRRISLDDVPSLPLAGTADMPPQAGFPRGSLGIHIGNLELTLGDDVTLVPESSVDAHGRRVLTLSVQNIALRGLQTLQGTQVWETDLDGAGTGLPKGKRLGGADQTSNKHPTWIATANLQQAKLQSAGNHGPTLLDTYNTHKSQFNVIFTDPNYGSFQKQWAIPAISQMADDTNTAVSTNGTINSASKTYPLPGPPGSGTASYNDFAMQQNVAVMTTLMTIADNKPDPTNPAVQAAMATLTFMNSVNLNTQPSSPSPSINVVPEHTPDDVFGYVQNGTPAPQATADDVVSYLGGGTVGGRDGLGVEGALRLTEDERAFVRRLRADLAADEARLAARKPVALVEGDLNARLKCYVHLQIDLQSSGSRRAFDCRVELDGFDLDFDDGEWDRMLGLPLARIAREALNEARFIKSLLHDRIADALERTLVAPAAEFVLSGLS